MSDSTEEQITETHIDYAERRRQRAAERAADRSYKVKHNIPVIAAVAVAAVLLLAVVGEAAATAGRIHPGVSVSGVKVGGLIPGKAKLLLDKELAAKAESSPAIVTYGDKSWKVAAQDVGVSFDTQKLVDQAMQVGREDNALVAVGHRLRAWAVGQQIAPAPAADDERMGVVLDRISQGTDVAPVDADVSVSGTSAEVVPGKNGRALDRDKAGALILAALMASDRRVEAPVGVAEVAVSDADAAKARDVALQMLSAPVKVTFNDKSWSFEAPEVADWIEFVRSDASTDDASVAPSTTPEPAQIDLIARIAAAKVGKHVASEVGAGIGRPAKDARFRTTNGAVTIIPSQDGIGPNMVKLAGDLTQVLSDPAAQRTVELQTTRSEPKITTEDARAMGVNERISTFTTTYDGGNRPRVNNIHLLGDALDGKLVPPGGTFSFNGAVGERTADKGYKEANAIVNGKLVPQLGGGICQVGTTIFNAVFESGLPVVQRKNHSFYISHYPDGRDATVSWGGPDFKFKNTTEDWILVSVSYTGSSITISLYGTDPGYDVTAKKGPWRNVKPFPVQEIKDPTMALGAKTIEDAGVDGRTITVERIVKKDGKVIRTDEFVSVYKPKVQVVRVGTKPKVPPARPVTTTPKP